MKPRMRNLLALLCGVASLAATAPGNAQQPYIGDVITVGFDFCPIGWAPTNGQLLPIAEYDALFTLITTTYGGDGEDTFALPLKEPLFTVDGKPLIHCISLFGIFPPQN
jgi:microcystin-dependent protein